MVGVAFTSLFGVVLLPCSFFEVVHPCEWCCWAPASLGWCCRSPVKLKKKVVFLSGAAFLPAPRFGRAALGGDAFPSLFGVLLSPLGWLLPLSPPRSFRVVLVGLLLLLWVVLLSPSPLWVVVLSLSSSFGWCCLPLPSCEGAAVLPWFFFFFKKWCFICVFRFFFIFSVSFVLEC